MSAGILLRPVANTDLPLFYEHQTDPRANGMAGWVPRAEHEFLEHWARSAIDPRNRRLTIVSDRNVAGYVGSFEHEGRREVCYWLGREWWGKGIATAALQEFIRGEEQRPLYAGIAKRNRGSIRVVEKCGFVFDSEGRYTSRVGEDIEEVVYRLD